MTLIEPIIEQLQRNQIHELDLSDRELSGHDIKQLAAALEHNHSLQKLSLAGADVESGNVKSLCRALARNQTLRVLDLSECGLGDREAQYIADMLERNTALSELYLDDNDIGDKGIRALGGALFKNKTLSVLSVRFNAFGEKDPGKLLRGLRKNQTLCALMMDGNDIKGAPSEDDDEGAHGYLLQVQEALREGASKNLVIFDCADEALQARIDQNRERASVLLEKLKHRHQFPIDEVKEMRERLPGMLIVAEHVLEMSPHDIVGRLKNLQQAARAVHLDVDTPGYWRDEIAQWELEKGGYYDRTKIPLPKRGGHGTPG